MKIAGDGIHPHVNGWSRNGFSGMDDSWIWGDQDEHVPLRSIYDRMNV
jgi:hypothetical protein